MINRAVEISEYEPLECRLSGGSSEDEDFSGDSLPLSDPDFAYLKTFCDKKQLSISYTEDPRRITVCAKQFVGMIKLPSGNEIFIKPKFDNLALMYMLYAVNEEMPPGNIAQLEEGNTFLDMFGVLFCRQLQEIIRKGAYAEYVTQRGALAAVRGGIDVALIAARPQPSEKIDCVYDELTYDNPLNQIIVWAGRLLTRLVRSPEIKSKLLCLMCDFEGEVSVVPVTPYQANAARLTVRSQHYEMALKLSQWIIGGCFYRSLSRGRITAFAFLIDMNKLFEDFITKIVNQSNLARSNKWKILSQKKSDNLLTPVGGARDIVIKPDILIRNDSGAVIVIDAKYKVEPSQSDFYQIVCYGVAHKCPGVLISPDNNASDDFYDAVLPDGHALPFASVGIHISSGKDYKSFIDSCVKKIDAAAAKMLSNNR